MSDLQIHRARWVLPITTPPLPHGVVAVRDGKVVYVGSDHREVPGRVGEEPRDLGEVILMPGLVNAHTHLSLSGLGDGLPRGDYFGWMAEVTRRAAALSTDEVRAAVREGLAESWRLGTVAVGEITTRPEGALEIAAHGAMSARVFFEFLGVTEPRARERFHTACELARNLTEEDHPRVRAGLSPHAPYSVWPDLWPEMAAVARDKDFRWSTHLAEAPGEDRFLREGTGPLRDYLENLGVWDGSFPLPGRSAVSLLQDSGALGPGALLVHGVHLAPSDLAPLAASGSTVCLCPRSNAWLGLPPAPVGALREAGIPLCLGTDSRAGNEDLSLWAEMRAVWALAPGLPAEEVVRMGTVSGGLALGLPELASGIGLGVPARLLTVNAEGIGDDNPYEFLLRAPVEAGVSHLLHL